MLLTMNFSFLKRFTPRSLLGRALLILMLPIILLQIFIGIAFTQRYFEGITRQMTRSLGREMAVAMLVIDTSPTAEIAQARLENLSQPLALRFHLDENGVVDAENQRPFYDLSGTYMIDTLNSLLGDEISVDLATNKRAVYLKVLTEKGVLSVDIPRERVTASNPHQLPLLMIIFSTFLIIVSVLFLRNQIRPILSLANAAEAFGKGNSVSFQPGGSEEIRRAGHAFLSMRARLERQMEQRTQMLSGVSHDLRTPLTRMKLTLAIADDLPEADDLARDVSDMETMLDGFLAFARGDQLEEMEPLDPVGLCEEIVAKCRRSGMLISLAIEKDAELADVISGRKLAIGRAVGNLLNNAAHYGTNTRLTLRMLKRACEFVVEDNGPGIPQEERENVTRPFVRLDASRNQNKGGGVGLGLSIAADVARSHGGALLLDDSPDLGGLRATLRLPR